MSAGVIIVLVMVGLLILSGLAIAWLWNSRKKDKALIFAATSINAELKKSLSDRDQLIKKLQEADNVANQRKDAMASGTTGDRVTASVDVLHDISGKAGTAKG